MLSRPFVWLLVWIFFRKQVIVECDMQCARIKPKEPDFLGKNLDQLKIYVPFHKVTMLKVTFEHFLILFSISLKWTL